MVLKNFDDAVAFCRESRLAGYDNWRLPMVSELRELARALSGAHPFISLPVPPAGVHALELSEEHLFWAADLCYEYDEVPLDPDWYAYQVTIPGGGDSASLKELNGRVWMVRGLLPKVSPPKRLFGCWPSERFQDCGDGTVIDRYTSLVWAKDLG